MRISFLFSVLTVVMVLPLLGMKQKENRESLEFHITRIEKEKIAIFWQEQIIRESIGNNKKPDILKVLQNYLQAKERLENIKKIAGTFLLDKTFSGENWNIKKELVKLSGYHKLRSDPLYQAFIPIKPADSKLQQLIAGIQATKKKLYTKEQAAQKYFDNPRCGLNFFYKPKIDLIKAMEEYHETRENLETLEKRAWKFLEKNSHSTENESYEWKLLAKTTCLKIKSEFDKQKKVVWNFLEEKKDSLEEDPKIMAKLAQVCGFKKIPMGEKLYNRLTHLRETKKFVELSPKEYKAEVETELLLSLFAGAFVGFLAGACLGGGSTITLYPLLQTSAWLKEKANREEYGWWTCYL